MTMRLIVLFSHIVGMLVFFVALAYEWLVITAPDGHAGLERAVQRLYGIGSGVLLLSGIYMARGGYFEFWWVRGPLILLVVMGVIGGATRRGSISARRTSWFVRLTLALVAVYLMVFKP